MQANFSEKTHKFGKYRFVAPPTGNLLFYAKPVRIDLRVNCVRAFFRPEEISMDFAVIEGARAGAYFVVREDSRRR
jgi:hypothetical protein